MLLLLAVISTFWLTSGGAQPAEDIETSEKRCSENLRQAMRYHCTFDQIEKILRSKINMNINKTRNSKRSSKKRVNRCCTIFFINCGFFKMQFSTTVKMSTIRFVMWTIWVRQTTRTMTMMLTGTVCTRTNAALAQNNYYWLKSVVIKTAIW